MVTVPCHNEEFSVLRGFDRLTFGTTTAAFTGGGAPKPSFGGREELCFRCERRGFDGIPRGQWRSAVNRSEQDMFSRIVSGARHPCARQSSQPHDYGVTSRISPRCVHSAVKEHPPSSRVARSPWGAGHPWHVVSNCPGETRPPAHLGLMVGRWGDLAKFDQLKPERFYLRENPVDRRRILERAREHRLAVADLRSHRRKRGQSSGSEPAPYPDGVLAAGRGHATILGRDPVSRNHRNLVIARVRTRNLFRRCGPPERK
jgi:hypothetical protein